MEVKEKIEAARWREKVEGVKFLKWLVIRELTVKETEGEDIHT